MMMALAPLVLLLQAIAPAAPATTLSVLAGEHASHVPIVEAPSGRAVRADLLATALGGGVRRLTNGHYAVMVPGAVLEVRDRGPFATTGTAVVPLLDAPYVQKGLLYLSLATVADVVPRVASGVLYDPDRVELRVFAALPPMRQRHVASAPTDGGTVDPSGDVLVSDSTDVATNVTGTTTGGGDDPAALTPRRKRHLVVVDAGHGGPDHGMIGPIRGGPQILEKDITLAVALKLGTALRARGIDVVETRTRDTLIALDDRGRMANARGGDLFISIHVNAANPAWRNPPGERGFETYFLAAAKTEDDRRVERMENEAVKYESGSSTSANDPLNFIMKDMEQNEHLRESSTLATVIQRHLDRVHPGPDRGVKQAGFRVLVTAYMPAVLVEIGFGTNTKEARFLNDPQSQRRIAAAISSAAVEYFAHYDSHAVATN